MNPPRVTSEELLAKAEELVRMASRDPRGLDRSEWLSHGETLIGEMAMMSEYLLVTRIDAGQRFPKIKLRCWASTPDGGRLPTRHGFQFDAKDLPVFGGLIAHALDLEMNLRPKWSREGERR